MNNDAPTTNGIKMKDKIGYALGDTAGSLLFGVIGSFLQMFYTDILRIQKRKIMTLLFIARIWDAVNDPMWGSIIDSRKPSKYGKFRQYLLWMALPLAVGALLTFTRIPGLSETQYLIYAYGTYIFYGMMYTGTNIPYGSLASVITDNEIERSELSVYRSIGAGLGGLPGQIILPLFVFSMNAGTGKKELDSNRLTFCVAVLALFSVITYIMSFKMTKERVASPSVPQKSNVVETIKYLLKNKPFITLCVASLMLIATQTYTQSLTNYLFKDYFEKPELYSVFTIAMYAPVVLLLPFMSKLVRRFGKKEVCAAGASLSAISYAALWLIKTQNPYIFLAIVFISGIGLTFFSLEVWALVTDVIDYQEHLSGRREEGTSYAFFSFTRKLGQTFSGVFGVYALELISYEAGKVNDTVALKMYNVSTAIPALMFFVMFLALWFFYPLSKSRLKQLHENEYKIRKNEV